MGPEEIVLLVDQAVELLEPAARSVWAAAEASVAVQAHINGIGTGITAGIAIMFVVLAVLALRGNGRDKGLSAGLWFFVALCFLAGSVACYAAFCRYEHAAAWETIKVLRNFLK